MLKYWQFLIFLFISFAWNLKAWSISVKTSFGVGIVGVEMSTGSTGSLLPKWQMAILLGAPIALGLGYLYYRQATANQLAEETGDTAKSDKKKLSDTKTKSISLDGDDKLPKDKKPDKKEPKQLSELEKAMAFKNDGNTRFKAGKFNEAIEFYNKAIETCPKTSPIDLSTFYQNRAAAYEQLKKWSAVKEDCTSALELNSKYIKALFRRAKASENTNDLMASLEDITATCILEGFQNNYSLLFADRVLKELGKSPKSNCTIFNQFLMCSGLVL